MALLAASTPGHPWVAALLRGDRIAPTQSPCSELLEALLQHLKTTQDIETLNFLASLEHERAIAKGARRALHELRAIKVAVAPAPRAPSTRRHTTLEQRLESLASIYDAQSYRIVWLAERQAHGFLVHRARISWRLGLVDLKSGHTSRGDYRDLQRQLAREDHVARISDDDARWLIHRAAARREARGAALPDGYLRASRALGSPLGRHPAAGIRAQEEDLSRLYELPELELWLPDEEALRQATLELQQIASSPLLVSQAQRQAQLEHALDAIIDRTFDQEMRDASREYLLDTAHFFHATGRAEHAELARGAAELFLAADAHRHTFARHFFERLFRAPETDAPLTNSAAPPRDAPKIILP